MRTDFPRVVEKHAAQRPEQRAFIFAGETISYAELDAQVNRVANSLLAMGLNRGDHIATVLPQSPAFVTTYLAAGKTGLVVVPLDPRLKVVDWMPMVLHWPRARSARSGYAERASCVPTWMRPTMKEPSPVSGCEPVTWDSWMMRVICTSQGGARVRRSGAGCGTDCRGAGDLLPGRTRRLQEARKDHRGNGPAKVTDRQDCQASVARYRRPLLRLRREGMVSAGTCHRQVNARSFLPHRPVRPRS